MPTGNSKLKYFILAGGLLAASYPLYDVYVGIQNKRDRVLTEEINRKSRLLVEKRRRKFETEQRKNAEKTAFENRERFISDSLKRMEIVRVADSLTDASDESFPVQEEVLIQNEEETGDKIVPLKKKKLSL